ncbi:hypothetical protein Taro_008001 [Colocasia esculenta]|uniref:Uncharacterized protein n=1 Tax=Colocasia esculenta TaxID=4460 RepID=A0A843U5M7_COLES|nr:hypothetical protein [Colocasia esculenta]
MAVSVPMPLQLILPIWKIMVGSSPSSSSASPLHDHYPSLSLSLSLSLSRPSSVVLLCLSYLGGSNRLWQGPIAWALSTNRWQEVVCAKHVVPNHKYCEHHMCQGHHCPIKLMERGTTSISDVSTVSPSTTPL